VNNIKKCHCASVITAGENDDMEVYRQLLNNVSSVYIVIANNVCCSSETISFFWVHMNLFLQSLICGCCVDIQQCGMYNIVSHSAHLDQTCITLLLWCHITVYNASHYGRSLTCYGSKL